MAKQLTLVLATIVGVLTAVPSCADFSAAVAAAKPAVVFIRHRDSQGAQHTGSGFVVSPGGYIVTCAHVVEPIVAAPSNKTSISDKIWVRLPDGTSSEAEKSYLDRSNDIAILQIPGANRRYLKLDGFSVVQGQEVLVLGYPLGQTLGSEMTVTRGVVSAVRGGGAIIQVDAAMNPGVSGGPVLNENGRVIGVAFARLPDYEGTNFAVAVSQISLSKAAPLSKDTFQNMHPEYWRSEESKRLASEAERIERNAASGDVRQAIDDTIECYQKAVSDPLTGSFYLTLYYGKLADLHATKALVARIKEDNLIAEAEARQAVQFRQKAVMESADPASAVRAYLLLADTCNAHDLYLDSVSAMQEMVSMIERESQAGGLDLKYQSLYLANCKIGEAYCGLKEYAKSEESLKTALQHCARSIAEEQPKMATMGTKGVDGSEAHYQLGMLYLSIGDRARAMNECLVLQKMGSSLAAFLKVATDQ